MVFAPLHCVLALALPIVPAAPATQGGESYCLGSTCPCGNDDLSAGCGNYGDDGISVTGAKLEVASGSTSTCVDDLVLRASGLAPGQSGLLFMGANPGLFAFGDGKLCVAPGNQALFRFPLQTSTASGEIEEVQIISRSQGFAAAGRITAGSTWHFQMWYRDPNGPCGSGFNTTNALRLEFTPSPGQPVQDQELVGQPTPGFPWFQYVSSFNQGRFVHLAVDPIKHPKVQGLTADVYVLADRDEIAWNNDRSLTDVRGTPTVVSFSGSDIQSNTFLLDFGVLTGTVDNRVGVAYDVVVDLNRNGQWDGGDLIDGYPDDAGFYVVRNVEAAGPYLTLEGIYTGGSFLGQKTYWPENIALLGKLPLVVVSHGNGHNYQWYDHIGRHLASYGYIVMSHQNNTMPGPEAASTTTLTNTDYLLGNLPTILGGVLDGHLDDERIIWIGHSRGGEGVVRAYDRLYDGDFTPTYFDIHDIRLISSIAPTDFLGPDRTNPHEVDYHLWTGSSDTDVHGGPDCSLCQTYHLLERAKGRRASITLHGAGHGAFHDGGGNMYAGGPCLLDRPTTHAIMRGYLLPLVRYFVDDDQASHDFLVRQWEEFAPIGAPLFNSCVVVNLELKETRPGMDFVLHDWQSGGGTTSSSGGSIAWNVTELAEGRLDDGDAVFTWLASDLMNGMTRASGLDETKGAAFSFEGPAHIEFEILPCEQDLSDNEWLSLRVCQVARHPNTVAQLEDLRFSISLRDSLGQSSMIAIATYGGGVEEPYQRQGKGTGAGWANEFETLRIRLDDFWTNGAALNRREIRTLRLDFGLPEDSQSGRIGLDDIVFSLR